MKEILEKLQVTYDECVEKQDRLDKLISDNADIKIAQAENSERLKAKNTELCARERIVKNFEEILSAKDEIRVRSTEVAAKLKELEAKEKKVAKSIKEEKAIKEDNEVKLQILADQTIALKTKEAEVKEKVESLKKGLLGKLAKELGNK